MARKPAHMSNGLSFRKPWHLAAAAFFIVFSFASVLLAEVRGFSRVPEMVKNQSARQIVRSGGMPADIYTDFCQLLCMDSSDAVSYLTDARFKEVDGWYLTGGSGVTTTIWFSLWPGSRESKDVEPLNLLKKGSKSIQTPTVNLVTRGQNLSSLWGASSAVSASELLRGARGVENVFSEAVTGGKSVAVGSLRRNGYLFAIVLYYDSDMDGDGEHQTVEQFVMAPSTFEHSYGVSLYQPDAASSVLPHL